MNISLILVWMVGIPILLRVINRQDFVRGPFQLGRFSIPIAVTAVTWIAFITIVFILPQINVRDRNCQELGASEIFFICSPLTRRRSIIQLLPLGSSWHIALDSGY